MTDAPFRAAGSAPAERFPPESLAPGPFPLVAAGLITLALLFAPALGSGSAGDLAGQGGPPAEPPPEWGPVSITMERVEYPAPVHFLDLTLYGQDVRLAYMDVEPSGSSNGRTVVLMHGSNFFGEYFHYQIDALTEAGFRVVVIDRVGYGKSSKPIIPYSISLMADNARKLLDDLGVERAAVVGHSMGGMVATRFAYLYPDRTSHLVLLNSIGLGEPEAGEGWRDFEESYQRYLDRDWESILGQQRYYVTEWKTEYEKYMRIHWGWLQSGDWPHMARVRALLSEAMARTSIYHDWPYIDTPALVMGGAEDGEDFPDEVRTAAERLQDGRVHLIPGVGHNAHIVVPEKVHEALIPFLRSGADTE